MHHKRVTLFREMKKMYESIIKERQEAREQQVTVPYEISMRK